MSEESASEGADAV